MSDRDLGMFQKISRRDFLNGIAVTAGASLVPPAIRAAFDKDLHSDRDYYPPALTGLRGSHIGSFETMHSIRDDAFWQKAGRPIDVREPYDLIVVGGGISGLSAAHFFGSAMGERARILILDNHDDFGGHAKRNEFSTSRGRMVGYGGTFAIESPAPYSAVAKQLIQKLGIDVGSYSKYLDRDLYRRNGLSPHLFFDRENFGRDKLVIDPAPLAGSETGDLSVGAGDPWADFYKSAPLSEQSKQDLHRLHTERKDYLPGLSDDAKKAKLARMSYAKFLIEYVAVTPEVVKVYQAAPHPLFGLGIDAVAAQDAWGLGFPGFQGMGLSELPGKGMNRDAIRKDEAERYFFHFPDGNASIARLLVRELIPTAIPGKDATDLITSKARYSELDKPEHNVKIRLNSTAVRVRHNGDPASANEVEVTYVKHGRMYRALAKHCILACWHAVIPYIAPELPEPQKAALKSATKVPLLYTNVAIRNWTAFKKLGVNYVYAPGSYHTHFTLDLPVSIGGYHCSRSPEEPIVIHMSKTPNKPGLPSREQHAAGRWELFVTEYADIERKIRDELSRTLGSGGFDPAHDITAITVNRWPHGYAYEYNSLWDSFWLEGGETPCEVARRTFGRISIANSDAAAYAYTDAAIDQAYRAVQEITKS